jgi:ABC-type multidrug transport system fused ATPase/permease subunit
LLLRPLSLIGVCSGKSSLLAAILRLLPEMSGLVQIDSVDTSDIDLSTLRRRIISIPQDFIHLPGSVRLNLDPFQQCADTQIESTLRQVKLWHKIASEHDLDAEFDPLQFSTGEKQLLSIARALLQREAQGTALVLMDEATSSLDGESEALIHRLLVEGFGGCTVINIAHRPASMQMADVVVSMEGGKIVRVGKAEDLAGSRFR